MIFAPPGRGKLLLSLAILTARLYLYRYTARKGRKSIRLRRFHLCCPAIGSDAANQPVAMQAGLMAVYISMIDTMAISDVAAEGKKRERLRN